MSVDEADGGWTRFHRSVFDLTAQGISNPTSSSHSKGSGTRFGGFGVKSVMMLGRSAGSWPMGPGRVGPGRPAPSGPSSLSARRPQL